MCVPKETLPAAQPSLVPTDPVATDLNLGGSANRGAAGLGRLALRLGSPSSAASAAPAPANAITTNAPSLTQTPSPVVAATAAPTSPNVPAYNISGLAGLRFGGLPGSGGFGR
jgi:hypothetical protein